MHTSVYNFIVFKILCYYLITVREHIKREQNISENVILFCYSCEG